MCMAIHILGTFSVFIPQAVIANPAVTPLKPEPTWTHSYSGILIPIQCHFHFISVT